MEIGVPRQKDFVCVAPKVVRNEKYVPLAEG